MAPLAQTREQSLADSARSGAEFQQQFPDIDVKKALIEPIINFVFNMQELINEADKKTYEILMSRVFEHCAEPAEAETFLWEARECLVVYPDMLKQFEAVFINGRPVEVVIAQIHDCLEVQRAMRAEKDLQEKDVGKRGSVE